jgi:dienelactone hydrolase
MQASKRARILIGLALMGLAATALADVPVGVAQTVVIVAPDCNEAGPEHARELADRAVREGAYQRAGECYLAAGQNALADQAFVKASTDRAKADTSARLAANLSDVRTQARQLKQAFQRR